jgi:polysaccharide chain length determinant protein (PEP-CTERM system associated)
MEELFSQFLSGLKGIWKYRWYAAIMIWLVSIAGWVKVATLPDNYQSSARVFVDTQSILKPLLSGMTSVPNVQQQVSIMSRTLLSRPNLERVLRMIDLDINAKTPRDHENQLDNLIGNIQIIGTSTYDIYTITYNNKNPKIARDVVQSLLTIFLEGSFKGKQGDSQKAVQFIGDQIKNYEDKLIAAENMVKEFKLKNKSFLPRQGLDYDAQLIASIDILNTAKLELSEAEQARNTINSQISGDEPVLSIDSGPGSIQNPELDGRISALNKNLDALRLQYTELHPDIIANKRLISQLEERKFAERKMQNTNYDPGKNYSPMLQQLKVALAEADAKVASIRVRVQEYTARNARLLAQSNAAPEVETQMAQLNRDYMVNKASYEKLLSSREAAKLSGELSSTTEMMTFRIIDPPTLPLMPTGPNRIFLFSAVLAAALLSGAVIALLISQVRPTFLSPAELRESTGLPVIGTVTMTWTDVESARRKADRYRFGIALTSLVFLYGGVLVKTWLNT